MGIIIFESPPVKLAIEAEKTNEFIGESASFAGGRERGVATAVGYFIPKNRLIEEMMPADSSCSEPETSLVAANACLRSAIM